MLVNSKRSAALSDLLQLYLENVVIISSLPIAALRILSETTSEQTSLIVWGMIMLSPFTSVDSWLLRLIMGSGWPSCLLNGDHFFVGASAKAFEYRPIGGTHCIRKQMTEVTKMIKKRKKKKMTMMKKMKKKLMMMMMMMKESLAVTREAIVRKAARRKAKTGKTMKRTTPLKAIATREKKTKEQKQRKLMVIKTLFDSIYKFIFNTINKLC